MVLGRSGISGIPAVRPERTCGPTATGHCDMNGAVRRLPTIAMTGRTGRLEAPTTSTAATSPTWRTPTVPSARPSTALAVTSAGTPRRFKSACAAHGAPPLRSICAGIGPTWHAATSSRAMTAHPTTSTSGAPPSRFRTSSMSSAWPRDCPKDRVGGVVTLKAGAVAPARERICERRRAVGLAGCPGLRRADPAGPGRGRRWADGLAQCHQGGAADRAPEAEISEHLRHERANTRPAGR